MLWVLKRTFLMRPFFRVPKTYAKTYGLENIYNFRAEYFCLSKPVIQPVTGTSFVNKTLLQLCSCCRVAGSAVAQW